MGVPCPRTAFLLPFPSPVAALRAPGLLGKPRARKNLPAASPVVLVNALALRRFGRTANSACTVVMSIIPKDRLCFTEGGFLRFHTVRKNDVPDIEATRNLIGSYPSGRYVAPSPECRMGPMADHPFY